MGCEFDGVVYGKLKEMREARRAEYFELVSGGMSFTQAAKSVGVSKRTGKFLEERAHEIDRTRRARSRGPVSWRHGRT